MKNGLSTQNADARGSLSFAGASRWPSDGVLQALKWLALAAMVADHVGSLVVGAEKGSWLYHTGLCCLSTFRNHSRKPARIARRGSGKGTRSDSSASVLLGPVVNSALHRSHWAGVATNIFFTLALGACVCWLAGVDWRPAAKVCAHLVIFALSFGCDYFAPGVYLIPAVYFLYFNPGPLTWVGVLACAAGLAFLGWSLAALIPFALMPLAHAMRISVPPARTFFYVFYPLHLAVLAAWVHWR